MPARPEKPRIKDRLPYIVPTVISCAALAIALAKGGDSDNAKNVSAAGIPECPAGFTTHNGPVRVAEYLTGFPRQVEKYVPSMFSEIDTPSEALCSDGDKLYISPQARIVLGAMEAARSARNG
jgi:hypothetical protein